MTPRIDAERILLIGPTWVGDAAMATPAFASIRKSYPRATIDLVIRPYLSGMLDSAGWFDEIITFDKKGPVGTALFGLGLRKRRYDLAIVFPNSFRSALSARLSGAKRRVGYARDGRGFLLTDRLRAEKDDKGFVAGSMVDYYARLAEHLGCEVEKRITLAASEQDSRAAKKVFAEYSIGAADRLVLLNPGAKFGSSKCWPAEYFAAVGDALGAGGKARVCVLAGPGESPIAEEIAGKMKEKAVVFAPEDVRLPVLKGMFGNIRGRSVLITNDTGPSHFAAAFDIPAVIIYGPTDPAWSDNYYSACVRLRANTDCRPCMKPSCPLEGPNTHRCMRGVKPEEVVEAAAGLTGG